MGAVLSIMADVEEQKKEEVVEEQKKEEVVEEQRKAPTKEDEKALKVVRNLMRKSNAFAETYVDFPTTENRLKTLYMKDKTRLGYFAHCAQETRIIVHRDVFDFMGEFIKHKQTHGSSIEKIIYEAMTPKQLALRLISKRPLYFFGRHDRALLRDQRTPPSSAWPALGKDSEAEDEDAIDLYEYISYDEMQVSALLGVSSPVTFINSGGRHNQGVADTFEEFEEEGVYVGLVGARFEKTDQMESTQMVISQRTTEEAGYGKKGEDTERRKYLAMWAKLYKQGGKETPHFPSYEELNITKTAKGVFCPLQRLGAHFNVVVFKKRMRFVIEPFLFDADRRGKAAGKDVYVFAVGLGLGVWAIDSRTQGKYIVQMFGQILDDHEFERIKVIDFSWFPNGLENDPSLPSHDNFFPVDNKNEVKALYTQRNPADKLTGKYEGFLNVACFAWDGNSFPGNEYWAGMLCASGDPAAASCSTIPEIQNAYVNETLSKESCVTVYP